MPPPNPSQVSSSSYYDQDSHPTHEGLISSLISHQYRTGRTLSSGTDSVVKEAFHIKTDRFYTCKVINKKRMEGREFLVRNEMVVLKIVSRGAHPNIATLLDYFESSLNLFFIFDLCSGGNLFERINAEGNYSEVDAAYLVRNIMKAVEYIHLAGIAHRDLKAENLMLRTKAEDSEVVIMDFGSAWIVGDRTSTPLTDLVGTLGYMAPETLKKSESTSYRSYVLLIITIFQLATRNRWISGRWALSRTSYFAERRRSKQRMKWRKST